MRTVFETIAVSFSMFSALPAPCVAWTEKNTRWLLAAFPLVGIVIGGTCWGWVLLCGWLALPELMRGAGLTLLPVLITGGIHLDGFADTWDALSSHAPPEKKQAILQDPHLGAFAAIHLCCYFLADFAFWTALPRYDGPLFLLMFSLSRTLSALAVVSFPLAKDTGLAHAFAAAADKRKLRIFLSLLAVLLAVGMCLRRPDGAAAVLSALWVFVYYNGMAKKQFGGLSGDLAGWFLQTAELWMLGAACMVQYMEALL